MKAKMKKNDIKDAKINKLLESKKQLNEENPKNAKNNWE